MKITIKSLWPGIAGLLIATILFLLPGKEFPEEDWFAEIYLDKWVHVGLFATLVSLWCLPVIHSVSDSSRVRKIFVWIALLFLAYGIGIEWIQGAYIPNRTFGVDDMVADAVGCGIGFLFSRLQLKKQKAEGQFKS